ncbi:MAG: signal peptidase I, partial [Thermoanaerobaculia bacterium]
MRHPILEYVEAILVAVLFALFVKAFVFEAFQIPSASMEDNLLVGDHVLVNKFAYAPHRGPWARLLPYRDVQRRDVFVFRYPEDPARDFIKRVAAVPGDTVALVRKQLVVNGRAVPEPEVIHRDAAVYENAPEVPESLRRRDELPPFVVPPDSYFALGDNRDGSLDSRFWGTVPAGHVRGRAVLVYWSYDAGASPRTFSGRGAWVRQLI